MRHLPKAKARAAWAGQKSGLRKNPPNEKRLADYGIDKHLADRARKIAARRGNRVFNLGKRGLDKRIGLIKPVKQVPFDWYVPWESYNRPIPLAAQVAASGES